MSIADNEIIELFHLKNKKEEAFRLLVDKYKEKLYWHIRKIVLSHEDSNDILQNTFVKIWQGLKEFRYESGLYTWMYRIATNESINFLNEKKRKEYMEIPGKLQRLWKIFWKVMSISAGMKFRKNYKKQY